MHAPFDWRPLEELKGEFEKPFDLIGSAVPASQSGPAHPRQRILLEYLRDEEAIKEDYKFRAEMNRVRSLSLGACRLVDVKMEKNGSFEFNPKVSTL